MKTLPAFLTLLLFLPAAAAPAGGYHIINKFPVPGDGAWDYLTVDSAARRLYVSHGTQVAVLDVDSGAVVGKIPNLKNVHGIAIAPKLGRGFTSDGGASIITIFDLKTLEVLGNIPSSGKGPDGITYDSGTQRVFAMNGTSHSVTAIDAAKGTVVGTVDLPSNPEAALAYKGLLYVNLEGKGLLAVVDAENLTLKKTYPLAPCETPTGSPSKQGPFSMAMDRKNGRLFIGCRSGVMAVVDAVSGRVITTMPIGASVDGGAFDSSTGLIYMSCGDGTISIFHEDSPDKYSAVETVKTMPGAKTMALDPKTKNIYLSTAEVETAAGGEGKKAKGRSIKPGTFQVLVVGK